MKEAEAMERVCPFSIASPNGWKYCLGSLCMAWHNSMTDNSWGYCDLITETRYEE